MKKIIIVVGPTASGKTQVGIQLAKKFQGEIISCDSMQIYKKMNIGTAKVTEKEKQGIVHHLIDILDPQNEFSVNEFQDLAFHKIMEIQEKGHLPILVGGTGLYINSITYHLNFNNIQKDNQIRQKLKEISNEKGSQHLYDYLYTIDPKSCETIHPNNINRLIRAIEVYELTGNKYSDSNTNFRMENNDFDFIMVGLTDHREKLYERINQRVDQMLKDGLVDEVRHLTLSTDVNAQSMQAIGYKEVLSYLKNEISYQQMQEEIKQNSRRYAKRQLTWFRRDQRIRWFSHSDYKDFQNMMNSILQYVGEHL